MFSITVAFSLNCWVGAKFYYFSNDDVISRNIQDSLSSPTLFIGRQLRTSLIIFTLSVGGLISHLLYDAMFSLSFNGFYSSLVYKSACFSVIVIH